MVNSTVHVMLCRASPYFLDLSQQPQDKAAKGSSIDEVEKYSDRCVMLQHILADFSSKGKLGHSNHRSLQ
jgi:hypothetical protein